MGIKTRPQRLKKTFEVVDDIVKIISEEFFPLRKPSGAEVGMHLIETRPQRLKETFEVVDNIDKNISEEFFPLRMPRGSEVWMHLIETRPQRLKKTFEVGAEIDLSSMNSTNRYQKIQQTPPLKLSCHLKTIDLR